MDNRSIDPDFRVMSPADMAWAMKTLGLSQKQLARNLLLGKNGPLRLHRMLTGQEMISGPISAALWLWLAVEGHVPPPELDRHTLNELREIES